MNSFKDFYQFVNHEINLLNCYVFGLRLTQKYLVEDEKVMLMDRFAIAMLIVELNRNRSFLTKIWGSKCNRFQVDQNTENCKDFILDIVNGNHVISAGLKSTGAVDAYTLVAMLPHFQFLDFLGEHIGIQRDAKFNDNPFKEWHEYFNLYSNSITRLVETMVDNLIECLLHDDLVNVFCQSLKLEENFILGLTTTQNSFLPVLKNYNNPSDPHLFLFFSFFSTCTQPIINPLYRLEFSLGSDIIDFWGLRTREASPFYEQCIDSYISDLNPVESYNYSVLKRKLYTLSLFEKRSSNILIESEFFVGLSREDIEQDGEHINLKEDCIRFFKRITEWEDISLSIHVLSRCWRTDLIESAFFSGDVNKVNIHSNEFMYEGDTSTGVVRKVESAVDKINTFESILRDSVGERRKLTVYVGSTVSDLLCLLNADIGIVIGTNRNLRRLGSLFGVTFHPLFDLLVEKQNELNEERPLRWIGGSLGRVYTVSCWAQVQSFLVGS